MLIQLLFLTDNYSNETREPVINDIETIEEAKHDIDDIYSSLIYEEHSETQIKGRIYEGTLSS